jgi:hypothetical protein
MTTRRTILEMDLSIACPTIGCAAAKGEPCRGLGEGLRHFGRRLKWLMETIDSRTRGELVITDEHGPS